MAFRPEAGRRLPSGKLREPGALMIKRNQLVEMRKKRTTSDQSEPIGNTRLASANSENAVLTQLVSTQHPDEADITAGFNIDRISPPTHV